MACGLGGVVNGPQSPALIMILSFSLLLLLLIEAFRDIWEE